MNRDDVLVVSNILNANVAQMFIKDVSVKEVILGSNSNT